MNCFKYSVGDLVKMYDCQDHRIFYGYVTDAALDPKNNINMYEVYWFDEETSEYQPFSYHEEHTLQSHGGSNASIME